MQKITWPVVALVTACLAALVIVLSIGAPIETLAWVVIAILVGLGVAKTGAVQQQTNGNTSKQIELIRDLAMSHANKTQAPAQSPAPCPDLGSTAIVAGLSATDSEQPPG